MKIFTQSKRTALVACGAFAMCGISAEAALFGLTSFDDQLVTIDPQTGTTTDSRPLGQRVSGFGLATNQGRLYTFSDTSDRIHEINPFSATISSSIDIGVGDQVGEGALAFGLDGTGFLASANDSDFSAGGMNRLYSFDLASGTSSLLGQTAFPLDALAFSPGGTLFALGQAQERLFTVDVTDGSLTVVSELNQPQQSPFAALSFADDGTLFGVLDDRLYTIDTTSGAASPVSDDFPDLGIGVASTSGLAFAVPEPSVAGLGAFTGLLLLLRRRRA